MGPKQNRMIKSLYCSVYRVRSTSTAELLLSIVQEYLKSIATVRVQSREMAESQDRLAVAEIATELDILLPAFCNVTSTV